MKDDQITRLFRSAFVLLLIWFLLAIFNMCSAQTEDSVKAEINRIGIIEPEIVLAQAKLETGHFKSYSCKHRHNLFGFRYKGKYLEFETWQESVMYYKKWQIRKRCKDFNSYFSFLESIGYATDPDYIKKIKSLL